MRVCVLSCFQNIGLKVKKWPKRPNLILFPLVFGKKWAFIGQYLKNSLGNIPSKFYHDLYLPKTVEKWIYPLWSSFFLGMDFDSTHCVSKKNQMKQHLFKGTKNFFLASFMLPRTTMTKINGVVTVVEFLSESSEIDSIFSIPI